MSHFTRTLTFRTHDLGKDSVFVLTFDDKVPGIYKTVFPTAWEVTAFGEAGPYEFTCTYTSELGVSNAHISSHDTVIPASTYTHIDVGQKTTLTKVGNPPIYKFSKPESIKPPTNLTVVYNNTDEDENIGVGVFERPDREPHVMSVFERVGHGSSVQFEFTPILRGYITSGYKENAVLRGQISTHLLFKENLALLDKNTNWIIKYHDGEYKIIRDFTRHGLDA